MEILPGIHQIDGVNCNCYLVRGNNGLTLIDTGMPWSRKKILAYINSIHCQPTDIKTIIITHCHFDHVGSLDAVKKATGAKVAAHEEDADFISGKKSMPMPAGRKLSWRFRIFRLLSPFMKAKPVVPDILLKDGDEIAGMEVLHTPGHTPGSICLYDKRKKVLFVGDLLRFMNGKIAGPPITLDEKQVRDSEERITKLDFNAMLSGHGEPLLAQASEKARTFIASQKA
jgi:hydroxyacylglutathione hydrolase